MRYSYVPFIYQGILTNVMLTITWKEKLFEMVRISNVFVEEGVLILSSCIKEYGKMQP